MGTGCFSLLPAAGEGSARSGLLELGAFLAFARASPPHPQLHRILISCAVDAFADKNLREAFGFTRVSLYCRAVSENKGPVLRALEAGLQAGGLGPAEGPHADTLRALTGSIEEVNSRIGLLRTLRGSMTCNCLAPFASALPCAAMGEDPIEDGGAPAAAAASGGGGGGGRGGGAAEEPRLPALDVEVMSARELKAALAARGIPIAGLLEKQELQQALRDALEKK